MTCKTSLENWVSAGLNGKIIPAVEPFQRPELGKALIGAQRALGCFLGVKIEYPHLARLCALIRDLWGNAATADNIENVALQIRIAGSEAPLKYAPEAVRSENRKIILRLPYL